MTPDLPIPEAAIEAGAEAYWERMRYAPSEPDWPGLVAKDSEEAEVYREAALTVLAAALPHLRSLQVETQVEYGRALGRKEAANQIKQLHKSFPFGKTCPECHTAWPCTTAAACLDLEYPGQNATSEPRTDLPVGPSHPKDSQAAREPHRCRECGEIHVMGCDDCGADLDMRGHYPDCSREAK